MCFPDAQLGGGTGEVGVWPLAAIGLHGLYGLYSRPMDVMDCLVAPPRSHQRTRSESTE